MNRYSFSLPETLTFKMINFRKIDFTGQERNEKCNLKSNCSCQKNEVEITVFAVCTCTGEVENCIKYVNAL